MKISLWGCGNRGVEPHNHEFSPWFGEAIDTCRI